MRDLIERIAERHVGELSEAKDGIEKPWTIDGSQWMSLKGVKQPWAFEISPMQYARMGKSQKAAHDKKRAAEWQASMDAKKDWADAVLAASKADKFDAGDGDVHPEAKSVVRRGKMAADKEKEADLLSRAEKDNEIQSASDLKVGDRVFSVMARGYVTVEKVAKKSVRVAGARGSVKQDVKYLRWLSNDDMKSAALGEDVANSSSSDVYPSPLGEKEFKMRELIERIVSLKEADVYSITDFSRAENPSGDAQALAARIRKEIEKHMPPGAVLKCEVVRYLGRKSIHVTTALEKDLSKVANRIRDNDRALQTFYVDGVNDDDTLKDKLTATISRGGSLTVKPEPGSYYAFGHVKFGWRKKSGTPDQIVKHFGNYFKKVKKVIQDNKDMMPEGIETGTMSGLIEKSIERLESSDLEEAVDANKVGRWRIEWHLPNRTGTSGFARAHHRNHGIIMVSTFSKGDGKVYYSDDKGVDRVPLTLAKLKQEAMPRIKQKLSKLFGADAVKEDVDLEEGKMYRSSSEIAKDLKDVPWVKDLDSESAPKVVSYLSSKWTDPLQVAVYMAKDDAERKKKISTLKSVKGTAANKFLNALRMIETKYGQKDE